MIVGGGAAGLSAAVTLGRARRSTVVVDAGEPRNAPADGVQGFVTRDGMSPAEFVRTGRAEASAYGVRFVDDSVVGVYGSLEAGFDVETATGAVLRARRLIVTSGLVDVLPSIPGLREHWGRGVVHCPYCHGWEIRDRAVGVVGVDGFAVHQALLFRQWTDRVTLLLHDGPDLSPEDLDKLEARRIEVVTGPIESVRGAASRLTGVTMSDGHHVPLEALAVAPGFRVRAEFLRPVGLLPTPHPLRPGTRLDADPTGRTAVAGVWAAGNVAEPMQQVVMAAASGVTAAAAVNADLIDAETAAAVAAGRAAASVAESR
ncbi:thioredoxin reductase [Frondihabitans sucicola]|uniref:Thioredoxin reductase n=1 Tax=Frondihabitans sucicola TaxID=1268041 RepID=A0ABM8GUF9_9MICO|nr:thioredoxin reductase [Frondihabitans sucicola]